MSFSMFCFYVFMVVSPSYASWIRKRWSVLWLNGGNQFMDQRKRLCLGMYIKRKWVWWRQGVECIHDIDLAHIVFMCCCRLKSASEGRCLCKTFNCNCYKVHDASTSPSKWSLHISTLYACITSPYSSSPFTSTMTEWSSLSWPHMWMCARQSMR